MNLWTSWDFDPGVIVPMALSAVLYVAGSRGHRASTRVQKCCFWSGWLSLAAALVSPLHPLGEQLFFAHMTQHEILMLACAPLLVVSRPLATFLWALPLAWRRGLGRWSKRDPARTIWRVLTDPLVAWLIHALAIWCWHIPRLFDWTLESDAAHAAQHASFFFSALLFWWSLFYAHGRKNYGTGVLYVFTTAIHTGILGALLTFAAHPWYAPYAATAGRWGFAPLEDQQLGGLIMWVPANLVFIAAGLYLFAAWLHESDTLLERRISRAS